MKKTISILGLLILIFICVHYAKRKFEEPAYPPDNTKREVLQNENKITSSDSLYFQPQYFITLYKHIITNGKLEVVNTSSRIEKTRYIEYRVLP